MTLAPALWNRNTLSLDPNLNLLPGNNVVKGAMQGEKSGRWQGTVCCTQGELGTVTPTDRGWLSGVNASEATIPVSWGDTQGNEEDSSYAPARAPGKAQQKTGTL